jgi:histidinol-phosphate aminotransferase
MILGLKVPGPSKPAHFSLEPLIRPNILALTPYRCARDDYSAGVLLDANENAIGPSLPSLTSGVAAQTLSLLSPEEVASLNRYPSPTHDDLKRAIAAFRGVPDENWVFLGVGSDEVIDMLFRVLCIPGKDRVMTCPPTYGMYKVTANVNDVGVVEVPLDGDFQLNEQAVSLLQVL